MKVVDIGRADVPQTNDSTAAFLTPPIVWIPFIIFVAVNIIVLALGQDTREIIVTTLAFDPGRYANPASSILLLTAPFTYFLVCSEMVEFFVSSLQFIGFSTLLALHLGSLRYVGLLVFFILAGPTGYLFWNGLEPSLFVGPAPLLGGFQGCLVWVQKLNPASLRDSSKPAKIPVTLFEIVGIIWNLYQLVLGVWPRDGIAFLLGFALGAFIRPKLVQ